MVSLEFKIDPESPDAVYTQLKEQLRSAVDSGPLSDATKLPPIRSLATAAGAIGREFEPRRVHHFFY